MRGVLRLRDLFGPQVRESVVFVGADRHDEPPALTYQVAQLTHDLAEGRIRLVAAGQFLPPLRARGSVDDEDQINGPARGEACHFLNGPVMSL